MQNQSGGFRRVFDILLTTDMHVQELSKVAGLQKKVEEVKGIMVDNIEQVNEISHLCICIIIKQ